MEKHIHTSALGNTRLAFEYYSEGISLISRLHSSRKLTLGNCNIAMIIIILLLCMADLSLSQTSNLSNCTLTCADSRLIACSPKRIPMSINLGVTDREVCHTNRDCYGKNLGEPNRVQQRPVNLILGQILIIRLDPLNINSPSKLWQLFRISSEQFFSCTSFTSNGTLASNVTQNSSFIFNSSHYGPGRHYLAGNVNNILSCSLGLRISITVKAQNCAVGGSGGSYCSSKGICIATQNDSVGTCSCCNGFNGTFCSEYNACTSNPCLNSGNCTDIVGGFSTNFSCTCTPYYTGRTCETQINYCNPNPCASNATCNNLVLQKNYSCNCLPGFTGRNCEVNINDCLGNNCTQNATCIDLVNGYHCECNGNWTGEFCNQDINECNSLTCLNNGTCTNTPGSFYCTCPVNVTGQLCETDLFDNCLSSPCMNQGTCSDRVGGFLCTCLSGYTGERCQTDINECLTNPCAVEGTSQCINGPGNYTCVCLSEYTGRRCEQFLDRCASQPCLNGGLCVNLYGRYSCVCPAGYRGSNCQDVLNKCSYAPCKNNGTCERVGDFLSNYTCHCAAGWTGRNCTEDINECKSNPCLNNATCQNLFNSYACICTVGWSGTSCQTNVDACEAMPCKNNATCTDLQTGLDYTCTCSPGFTGTNCSVNIDDCIHLNANCNNGRCVDQVGSFYCNCSQGWFGKYCDTNRNMCASRPCMNQATCENVNTTLGYVCNCRSGWTGANCETNIDDCISNLCRNGATCNDFLSFYNCTCKAGYTGQYCETEINECLSMPCLNNATCVNNIGNFSCICNQGYTGAQCEIDINECASFPCFNNATCVDEVNRYRCRCHGGYVGVHCEVPLCRTNPCRNGAACIQSRDRYTCQCQPGYTGLNCEVQIDECGSIPCQNNATCVDLVNGYQCNCLNGYTGRLCETHLCDTSVCQNGASCQRIPSGYACSCLNGYTGLNCEQPINECLSNPCNAAGSLNCTDLVGGYRCYCKAGYLGLRCENHTCEALQPCQNGASCVRQPSGYQCMCLAGFTGINCESNINECASDPCLNGTCIDRINGYSCNCSAMYTGIRCETNMNLCASRPCMNNSTCENNITSLSFICECQAGFTGTLCQSHLCDTLQPCLNNGTCLRLPHNYSCQCELGFTGSRCEIDVNECSSDPCFNSGACINGRGTFTCSCPKNFTGSRCETYLDYCSASPCINNGTCVNNYTSQAFNCLCPPAFSGRRCELHICDLNNPCQNGAACLRDFFNARCVCLPGFTGQNCSIDINECESSPCINNGSCVDGVNGFTCHCPAQYTGGRCDDLADYCASNPCTNSSTCVNDYVSGTYKCNCHPFRTGRNCEVYLGPCGTQPCLNNGTCIETVAQSYRCVCPFGYSGPRCESLSCPCQNNGRCALFSNIIRCICPNQYGGFLCENFYGDCRNNNSKRCIDNSFCVQGPYGYFCRCPGHLSGDTRCTKITTCSPSPCLNGASCTNTGFTSLDCACSAGYTGQFCQFDINECASSPCQNGGTCLEVGAANFTCYCPSRYYGDRCQNETASTSISQVFTAYQSSFQSTYSFQSTTYVTKFFQTSSHTDITATTILSPPVISSSSYYQIESLTPSFSSSMAIPVTRSTSPSKHSTVLDSIHFPFSSQLTSIRLSIAVSQASIDQALSTSYQTSLIDQSQPSSFASTISSKLSIQTLSIASVIPSSSTAISTLTAYHLSTQSSTSSMFLAYISSMQPSSVNSFAMPNPSIDSAHIFSSLSQGTAIPESFISSPSASSLTPILPSSSKAPSTFHSSLSLFSSNVIQSSLVHTSSQLSAATTPSLQPTSTNTYYTSTTLFSASLSFDSISSSVIASLTEPSSVPPSASPVQSSIQSQAMNLSSNQVSVIPISSIQSSIYMSLSSFIQFSSAPFVLSPSSTVIPAFVSSHSLFSSNAFDSSFKHSSSSQLTTAISTHLQSSNPSITSSFYYSTAQSSVSLPFYDQRSDISSSAIPSIAQTSSIPSSFSPQRSTIQSPAVNISSNRLSIMPVSSIRSSVYFSSSPHIQFSSTQPSQFQSSFYNSSPVHASYRTAAFHSSQSPSSSLFHSFSSSPIKSSLQFTETQSFIATLPETSSSVASRYSSISGAIPLQSSLISVAHPSLFPSILSTLNFSVNSISLSLQISSDSSADPIHAPTTSVESPLQSLFSFVTPRSFNPMASSISLVQSSFMPLLSTSMPPSNPCIPNPCLQRGNCTQLSANRFNCSCEIGYGGQRCNDLVCQCQSNGRCVRDSPVSSYRCICRVGFSGKYCENRIGDCRTQNCSGNGICRERLQGFVCVCNRGFYGDKCENFTSSCQPNPCQNSGICMTRSNETGGGFTCVCPQGYQGQLCQFDYNECASSPCLNGGTCRENQINSYQCYCPAWSYGTNCELLWSSSAFSVVVVESSSLLSSFASGSASGATSNFQSLLMTSNISQVVSFMVSSSLSQAKSHFTSQPTLAITSSSRTTTSLFASQSAESSSYSRTQSQTIVSDSGFVASSLPVITRSASDTTTQVRSSGSTALLNVTTRFSQVLSSPSLLSPVSGALSSTPSISLLPRTYLNSQNLSTATSDASLQSAMYYTPTMSSFATSNFVTMANGSANPDWSTFTAELRSTFSPSPRQSSLYSISSSSVEPTSIPLRNLTCVDNACNGYPCYNESNNGLQFRCVCLQPTFGPRCIQGITIHFPFFNGHSYVEYAAIPFNNVINTIVLTFRTTSSNGMLLYAGHQTYRDFILLRVANGLLEFTFNAGAETVSITTSERVDTGVLTTIIAKHDSRSGTGTLSVNGSTPISRSSSLSFTSIQLSTSWFIGGLNSSFLPLNTSNGLPMLASFIGCIRDMQVNTVPYRVLNARSWLSISECDVPACKRGPCRNNATCLQNLANPQDYTCQCGTGYYGQDCTEREAHCQGDPCNGGTCAWTPTGHTCLCQYGKHGSSCLSSLNITRPTFNQFDNYSSYIEYPWQQTVRNADARFDIKMQFKLDLWNPKSSQNGLLAFAGQSTIGTSGDDFFALGIVNNYTYLIYNLGGGLAVLRSSVKIDHSRRWHFIVAGRNGRSGYMHLDSHPAVYTTAPGVLTGLDVYSPLYLGGVPDFSKVPPIVRSYFTSGFFGTIFDPAFRTTSSSFTSLLTFPTGLVPSGVIGVAVLRGLNIGDDNINECLPNPCQNNGTCSQNGGQFICSCQTGWTGITCQNSRIPCIDYNPCSAGSVCQSTANGLSCDCQLGRMGTFCDQTVNVTQPYFKANSFLGFQRPDVKYNTKVYMRFKAAKLNGLLFYVSEKADSSNGDFFAISLWQGFVYVRFNLGLGTAVMSTRNKITLKQWHELYVERRSREAIMRLDSYMFIGVKSPGSYTQLNVGSIVYLGGIPRLSALNPSAVKDLNSQRDFEGAVSHFIVNNIVQVYAPGRAIVGRNIEDGKRTCVLNDCQNAAKCSTPTTLSNYSYICTCNLGWEGRLCNSATAYYSKARFSGDGFIFYQDNVTIPVNENHIELSFNTLRDGLLLWLGDLKTNNSEYLAVAIINSKLTLSINTGGGVFQMQLNRNISDGVNHRAIITRIRQSVFLTVNGFFPVLRDYVSSDYFLSYSGHIFIGGLDENVRANARSGYSLGFTGCIWNVKVRMTSEYLNLNKNSFNRGVNVRSCD